ncbi:FAD/NAD(P)-binding protein [Zavarzinia sp.]|uniref:FAD/NAD(P)-binding protein n=1 Tax=Zavarzinia sp. TaxID=2027920 RepID=UPI003562AAA2
MMADGKAATERETTYRHRAEAARPLSVAVVGGGVSGAAVAIHLARLGAGPLDLHIVEPRHRLGYGLAYDTAEPANRVNVPSTRLSLFAADPDHFDRWLKTANALADDPEATLADGRCYARRRTFGRYVEATLQQALAAQPEIALSHHAASAVQAEAQGSRYRLLLDDGSALTADILVLASGHPPPAPPDLLALLAGHPRYLTDPWADEALNRIRPDDRVIVIGTGLTMADIVAALERRGHRGSILAVSRRGLLSRGQAEGTCEAFGDFAAAPCTSALALLRKVRAVVAEAEAAGRPWQAVFDAVRRDAQRQWAALPPAERRRLLRWLRPWWDAHRYRTPPQVQHLLDRLLAEGRLAVRRGHLAGAAHKGETIALELRHGDALTSVEADALVVATGPAPQAMIEGSPLLSSLAAAGLIAADPLGLGLATDRESRALGQGGRPCDTLLVAGPLARGTFGELVGVPQVSAQAEAIAARIRHLLGPGATKDLPH